MKIIKRIAALTALFLASCGAVQPAYAMPTSEQTKICIGVGEIAAGIMLIRQISDKGLAYFLKEFEGYPESQLLFMAAYEHPQYPKGELQQKVITDFKDRNILLCLSSFGKKQQMVYK